MKRVVYLLISIQCLCFSTVCVQAMDSDGFVRICVQDEKKHSIEDVEVKIKKEEGKIQSLTSDQEGMVYLKELQIGKYQLIVSPPKGYQAYDKQEFYITQYNQKAGMEMTIQLHTKHKSLMMKSDALLLFICLCNMLFYAGIYIFKTYNAENFTQSFDDFMV